MSPFASEFADVLLDTVLLATKTGQDGYGRATYGADQAVKCRIEGRPRLVVSHQGVEVASTSTVYLAEDLPVTVEDRITLPAPYVPTQPNILAVRRSPDESGQSVVVLYCG